MITVDVTNYASPIESDLLSVWSGSLDCKIVVWTTNMAIKKIFSVPNKVIHLVQAEDKVYCGTIIGEVYVFDALVRQTSVCLFLSIELRAAAYIPVE